jgi:hypothetical protein
MFGFPLADHGAIDGHAMRGHIFNLPPDHIAAAKLLSDCTPGRKKLIVSKLMVIKAAISDAL